MKVGLATLGCKVNRYDTEAMAGLFRRAGWQVVDFRDVADVYVVNTCVVTARSEAESRQLVRQARRRNPGALVVLCGCYPQARGAEAQGLTGADVVLGTRGRGAIVPLVERALAGERPLVEMAQGASYAYEEVPVDSEGRTRAVVKVQEGCDVRCTYCIVPAARGPARSRDPAAALAEVRRLVAAGFREVVLTGIQLGAYGRDLGIADGLATLVRRVAATEGLWRVRLSSLEPVDLSDGLLDAMAPHTGATAPRAGATTPHCVICPHLHLPLQSGSDRVLAAMGRPYRAVDYLRLVTRAREKVPGLALSTDVMVGFPGETEEDFAATLRLVEQVGFMRLHVFPYSPRPGTPAAGLPGQVPDRVKEERARVMREAGAHLARAFASRLLGQVVEVLAEQERGGLVSGFTRHYLRVTFPGTADLEGKLAEVGVTGLTEEGLRGSLAKVLRGPRGVG